MFLKKEEIAAATGYKTFSKQITNLIENGIKFTIRGDGSPNVHESEFTSQETDNGCQKTNADFSSLEVDT